MKILILATATLLVVGQLALAKPVSIPDEKVHLDIPESWIESGAKSGAIFTAADANEESLVAFYSFPNTGEDDLDNQAFLNGIQKGFNEKVISQGMTPVISREGKVSINGVVYYFFEGTRQNTGANPITFHNYVTAANNRIYMFSVQTTDAAKDAEMVGIAQSLAFDSPPAIPDSGARLSRHLGELLGTAVVLFLVPAVLWKMLRRKRNAS